MGEPEGATLYFLSDLDDDGGRKVGDLATPDGVAPERGAAGRGVGGEGRVHVEGISRPYPAGTASSCVNFYHALPRPPAYFQQLPPPPPLLAFRILIP